MKKALLVKPKDNYSYAVIPNLGLGYLAALLKKQGFGVDILDCNKQAFNLKDFEQCLVKGEYHLVGFQVYTNSLLNAKVLAESVKRLLPDAIIVIGGPHSSGDPEQALHYFKEADCIVVGEGEGVITKLMGLSKSDFQNKSVLSKINNIAFTDNNENAVINESVCIDNLDEIPMPAWELIDPRTYRISPHGTFSRAYPIAPIITSRGCPYPCTFCAGFKTTGKRLRRRSVGNVLDEVSYLYTEYGVREFHIEDDNFTFQKEYVMEFTESILSRGLKIWWGCPNGIRTDRLDKEILLAMEKSGCYSFGLGIESGSDRVLKMMKKNITVKQIEEKVSLIKNNTKINITGFFLIGYPGETKDDILKTIKFSRKLLLDKASFSPVMPLPGSEIYCVWKKKIKAQTMNWDKFLYYQIVPDMSEIDERWLKEALKKALILFYMRPRIIFGMLREIKTLHQFKVILKRTKKVLLGS